MASATSNSQAAKRLVAAAARAQFPEKLDESQIISILTHNAFRGRKLYALLSEILESATAAVPEDVSSTYSWLEAQQLIRQDGTLDTAAAREILREAMRAKHAGLSEVDDLERQIEEKERQLAALKWGVTENQQWMQQLHEKGRGRAAERQHARAAAELAQAKSDLLETCSEIDTVLQEIQHIVGALHKSFHRRSSRTGRLVLFSDFKQLVDSQSRFRGALSCANDVGREAAMAQHRDSVIDSREGRSRLLQDITNITRAAPSAHLSFSMARVRLAESEAARDVASSAGGTEAAQELLSEDRTGTAAGLKEAPKLEGPAGQAMGEVPRLCQEIGQLEALPDIEAIYMTVISRLRAELQCALKALSFQHSQLARNLLLQLIVEAEMEAIRRLGFSLHMLVRVLGEHFEGVTARTDTCKQVAASRAREDSLPGQRPPGVGTSFTLSTVQSLASASDSLKTFNQLVQEDSHSLLQFTGQLNTSSYHSIQKAEEMLIETGLQACNTRCPFPEAAAPLAQAQSEVELSQKGLEALQDKWQKTKDGNNKAGDEGEACRSTMLQFFE